MAGTEVVLAAVLVGIYVFSRTSGQPVPVGDSFNFSTTSQPQCPPGAELKLFYVLLNDTAVLVESRDGAGSWKASPFYAGRLEMPNSAYINYNDDGSYVLNCSDGEKTIQHALDLKKHIVSVNGTVHFPCYAFTVDEDVKSAWWKIKGKSVVRMYPASQKNTTGDGYKQRVSVPTDWFSKRNFTLTLGPVQLQDQGDYFCYIQDKHKKLFIYPVVARLEVQETRNETSSTGHPGPIPTYLVIIIVIVILGVLGVLGGALAIGIWLWNKSRRKNLGRQAEAPLSNAELVPFAENPDGLIRQHEI